MQVLSIKTTKSNNTIYSSEPSQGNDSRLSQFTQDKDEFLHANNSNKKVGFGTSVETLAKRYLYSSGFDSALRADIEDEIGLWSKIEKYLNNEYERTIMKKFNEVKSFIKKMKEEIAEEEEKAKRHRERIREQERDADREFRRINAQKEEMAKTLKLEGFAKKREQIKLEKSNIDIEEKDLNLEKELLQDQKLSDYTDNIKTKFVNKAQLEKEEIKNKVNNNSQSNLTFPNGIMLSGLDDKTNNELIQWTVKKSDCELKKVDFANLTENEALKELSTIANNAKQANKRTIIHIKNLDKFTVPTKNNEEIIPKLKNFLQKCAGEYKCTVITEVKDPSKLASAITADQRFEVVVRSDG